MEKTSSCPSQNRRFFPSRSLWNKVCFVGSIISPYTEQSLFCQVQIRTYTPNTRPNTDIHATIYGTAQPLSMKKTSSCPSQNRRFSQPSLWDTTPSASVAIINCDQRSLPALGRFTGEVVVRGVKGGDSEVSGGAGSGEHQVQYIPSFVSGGERETVRGQKKTVGLWQGGTSLQMVGWSHKVSDF